MHLPFVRDMKDRWNSHKIYYLVLFHGYKTATKARLGKRINGGDNLISAMVARQLLIFTFNVYSPLQFNWKSATFRFLGIH